MKRSKEIAVYHRPCCRLEGGKFVHYTEPQVVRVLVRAEGYAMVRQKGCMTHAVPEKELTPYQAQAKAQEPQK